LKAIAAALIAVALAGCGATSKQSELVPPRFGPAPLYRPDPLSRAVAAARPLADMRCETRAGPRIGVHLEVFVNRFDVVIPAGIGMAPPHAVDGAYITGARCSYPIRTTDPTGMIEVDAGFAKHATLGDFFAAWGQPLSPTRLLSFRAKGSDRVVVYIDGKRWQGDPRDVPLTRHAALLMHLGGYVAPRLEYGFPPDL
jgi:hypothetical protein